MAAAPRHAGRSRAAADPAVQADRGPPSPGRDRRRDQGAGARGARTHSAKACRKSAHAAIEFFDPAAYNAATTLQDNILFGKLAYGQARAAQRVGKLIVEILDELELRRAVLEVGLEFSVGVGGARLSQGQRQKLAIARALLKRPDLLILNDATAIFDTGVAGAHAWMAS